jgi:sodium-dependent dicarboxylate transporter 2/3/5
MTELQQDSSPFSKISLYAGPALALTIYFWLRSQGLEFPAAFTAFVAIWCISWWIFEPVPIPVTSLLPIATLPLFGVLTADEVGAAYGDKLILLLLGGFLLSTAMSYSGAHKRIALNMVNWFGANNPKKVVFGFITASAFLSMWISNTATTLMLLPVALAVLQSTDYKKLSQPLFLGIASAASVGGIGTPVGTPPNLIFMQVYEQTTGKSIGFLTWMSYALPLVIVFVPIIALWLTRNLKSEAVMSIPSVGAWSNHESRVLMVFAVTALLWVTRQEPFGGWSAWLNLPNANDASVALLAVICLFMIPSGKGAGEKLLNWENAQKIPWGVLLLFGGGICLAKAFMTSGLSTDIGKLLEGISVLPIFLMICLIAFTVTFMTEATSNTATTTLLMPILAAVALGVNIDPILLMLPATMSASCAFMLPVATAPNSVVFGSGYVTSKMMAREGFMLNLTGVVLISTLCFLMFG